MESLEQKIQRVTGETVALSLYDPNWPKLFVNEKQHLISCFPGGPISRVEHFGSTAVPGLVAKPIVDMLIGVTSLAETRKTIVPELERQGYDYFWRPTSGDDVPPWYAWFIKRDRESGTRTHHLHMVEQTSKFEQHWERLLFRDYLIANPSIASEYGRLKSSLCHAFENDRVEYTHQKAEFVTRITELAKRDR